VINYLKKVNLFSKKMTDNIEFVPFKKTYTFKTSFFQGSKLVRTGTKDMGDNSFFSFYNAVVHACSKKFVVEQDESLNMKDIAEFEESVVGKFFKSKKFTNLYDKITEELNFLAKNLYSFFKEPDFIITDDNKNLKSLLSLLLNSNDDKSRIEVFQIIMEIAPLDSIENKIIRNWRKKIGLSNNVSLQHMKFLFMKEVKKYLYFFDDLFDRINDKDRVNYIKINIGLLFDNMFDVVIQQDSKISLPKFCIESLADIIFIVSNLQKCNVFFIDSLSHKISLMTSFSPEYKSILLLSFHHKHFEVVGKLLPDERVQREFMPYEEITKALLFNKKSNDNNNR
jgi:hypothetical protein